jgi:hypothetical protein
MTNYRPVSLLTVLSKVLKKAMHSRLSQHLHTNNILVTELYGFRKGVWTEDAACRLTGRVFKSINQKMYVGGIFCDLVKTFDYINYAILLAELLFYRIWWVSEDWFSSCLTNRKQKAEVTSPNSTQIFSLTGVYWNMEFPKN